MAISSPTISKHDHTNVHSLDSTVSSPTTTRTSEATSISNFSPPTPGVDNPHPLLPHGMAASHSKVSVGESILRQYAHHLDPLHTDDKTHAVHDLNDPVTDPVDETARNTALNVANNLPSDALKASSYFAHHPTVPVPKPLSIPKSLLAHRKSAKSIEIPRQTIMKALVSRRPS